MSTAQTIAGLFNNDGMIWEVDGVTLDEACLTAGGVAEHEGEDWRYEFDDGSALTGNTNGWDIEGSAPYVMAGSE
jgi:hypothetical protein